MFSLAVCHQNLLQIVHREEVKVNYILHVKVEFSNSEKGPRDRWKLPHFTHFKKDTKKWRYKRANLVSNVENHWFVLVDVTSRFVRFKSKLEQKILNVFVFVISSVISCSNVMHCLYDDKELSIEEATGLVFRSYLVVLDVLCASSLLHWILWRRVTYSRLEDAYYCQKGEKKIVKLFCRLRCTPKKTTANNKANGPATFWEWAQRGLHRGPCQNKVKWIPLYMKFSIKWIYMICV